MEIQDGKGRQLENVGLPTLPFLSLRPACQDEKIASCYVSPHPNWSGSFTHYYVMTHTIWSTYNALPRYSMVASVHDYCIFKLFNNHAHSPQKEYRFLCAHVPSSTIPHLFWPASYIVLWKLATWRNKTTFINLRRSVEVLVEVWNVEVPVEKFEYYPGNDVFVKIWAILTFFQKCIEALIDKQYLERREGTKDEYTYMAWRDSNKMVKMVWSLKCIWRSLPDNSPLSWKKATQSLSWFLRKSISSSLKLKEQHSYW